MKGYIYKLLIISIVSLIAVSAVQADLVAQFYDDAGYNGAGAGGGQHGPTSDNTLTEGDPGYAGTQDNQILGYGGWETANVGARTTMQIGTGNRGGVRRPIIQWDLAAMAGLTVTAARVQVRKASAPDFTFQDTLVDIDLYAITAANSGWIQGTGVFAPAAPGESAWNWHDEPNGWAGTGGPFDDATDLGALQDSIVADGEDAANTQYIFDLDIALVQGWVDNPASNAGVLIKIRDEVNKGTAVQIYASEINYYNPYRPNLVITYTPEPMTIGLLSLGGLALLRRKRRA